VWSAVEAGAKGLRWSVRDRLTTQQRGVGQFHAGRLDLRQGRVDWPEREYSRAAVAVAFPDGHVLLVACESLGPEPSVHR
jgi:hypothetical protein